MISNDEGAGGSPEIGTQLSLCSPVNIYLPIQHQQTRQNNKKQIRREKYHDGWKNCDVNLICLQNAANAKGGRRCRNREIAQERSEGGIVGMLESSPNLPT